MNTSKTMRQNQRGESLVDRVSNHLAQDSQVFGELKISNQFIIFLFIFFKNGFGCILPLLLIAPASPVTEPIVQLLHSLISDQSRVTQPVLSSLLFQLLVLLFFGILRNRYKKQAIVGATFLYALSPMVLFVSICPAVFGHGGILVKLLYLGNMLGVILVTTYYLIISIGFTQKASNQLSVRPKMSYYVTQILIRITALYTPLDAYQWLKQQQVSPFVSWTSQNNNALFTVFCLMLRTVAAMYFDAKHSVFFSKKSCKINRAFNDLQVVISILVFLCIATGNQLVIQNFPYLILSTFFFLYISFERYTAYIFQEESLLEIEEITSSDQALSYLLIIEQIINIQKNTEINKTPRNCLFLKNFQRRHKQKCCKNQCSCKKSKFAPSEPTIMYINQVLQEILHRFQTQDPLLLFYILNMQLKTLYLYTESLNLASKASASHKKSLTFKYFLSKFKIGLKKIFAQQQHTLNLAHIEKVAIADEISKTLYQQLEEISQLKFEFWSVLEKEITYYDFFLKNTERQLGIVKKFSQLLKQILKEYENSEVLLAGLLMYEKFILLKNEIPSGLLQKLQEMQNMKKHLIFRQKSSNSKKMIENYMFGTKCCTFESIVNIQKMGTILKVSKNVEKVFGYSSKIMEGSNINKIMPKSMREVHDVILRNWAETGSLNNIGKVRKIFAINKKQICFSAGIYIKTIQRIDTINIIAICFEENDQDYLLVNDNGIIDGAGYRFISLLGVRIVGLPINLLIQDNTFQENQDTSAFERKIFKSVMGCSAEVQQYKCQQFSLQNNKQDSERCYQILKSSIQRVGKIYQIQYEAIPYRMGPKTFYVVKFIKLIQERGQGSFSIAKHKLNHQEDEVTNQKQNFSFAENDNEFFGCENSSMGLSVCDDGFAVDNVMGEFYKLFLSPEKIYEKKAFNESMIAASLTFVNLLLLVTVFFISFLGFLEERDIFEMERKQNHENMLLLYLVNNIMNMNVLKEHPRYLQILQEFDYERELVLSVAQKDFLFAFREGSLSRTPNYQLQPYQPIWTNGMGESVEVSKKIFTANLIGYSVRFKWLIEWNARQDRLESVLKLIRNNYSEIKQMKTTNENQYSRAHESVSKIVKVAGAAKFGLSVTLVFIILLKGSLFVIQRHNKRIKVYKQFGAISKNNCIETKKHFELILDKLRELNKNQHLHEQAVEQNISFLTTELDGVKTENSTKTVSNFKILGEQINAEILSNFWFILIVLIFNSLLFTWSHSISVFTEEIRLKHSKMEHARDQIVISYIDIKMHVLTNMPSDTQLVEHFLAEIDAGEIAFIEALHQNIIFLKESVDPMASQQLLKVYVLNICKQVKPKLPIYYGERCQLYMTDHVISFGATNTLNYISRKLRNQLKAFGKAEPNKELQNIINQLFVDSSLLFLFQISVESDAIMVRALESIMMSKLKNYAITSLTEGVQYTIGIILTVLYFKKQKIYTAQLYGTLCLIPTKIVKNSKQMLKQFLKITAYENNEV